MNRENFLQNLEKAYALVEHEKKLIESGSSKKNKRQLEFILKELKIMKNRQDYHPYYPRGISDDWEFDDELGNILMELAREYYHLKKEASHSIKKQEKE